jgi:hypothetical protein
METTGFYFDRNGFRDEMLKYEFAQKAIIRIKTAYAELECGEMTLEIFQQALHDIDSLENEYTSKQVALAGKSPLVKQAVSSIAMDRFERFRAVATSLTIETQLALNAVDFKLINLKGEIDEEKIRQKHTYEPKTENQKAFVSAVEKLVEQVESIKEFLPSNMPLFGEYGCFYIDTNGNLVYNPEAIKVVE